ncbi:MAG: CBS domain-containing protein [archaeon]|nr:CBS domain-containing protein [archaeon]
MEKVERYMTREVFILNPNDSLAKARNLMLTKKIGKLVIVDEKERILGIISRSDMAFALGRGSSRWRKRPLDQMLVKDLMVTKVITVSPSTPLNEVAKIMLEKDLSGLPVIDKGHLVGIITTHDMTKYLADYGSSDLKVIDVMDKKVVTASPFHSIHHLVELMASTPTRRVVIIDSEGRPIGLVSPSNIAFTKFDVKRKVVFRRSLGGFYEPTHRKVAYFGIAIAGDVMSSPVFIIHEEDSVSEVARNMVHNDIGALPVLDKNHHLTGIFSKREVLKVIVS